VFGQAKIAAVTMAALLLAGTPVLAQHAVVRPRPQLKSPPKVGKSPQQQQQQQESRQAQRVAQNHLGDWLRRYKDLPPDRQRKALENDPDFQKLPPHRQAQLLQQQQRFLSLPVRQQERTLSRMETWEHLTPEQKRQRTQLNQEIRQLPPPRRQLLVKAIRDMRDLTPEQREHRVNSDDFKNMFSDHERELLGGASRLPLAPGDAAGPNETSSQ